MAKYRKKPVVVEATQWFKNGDHPLDYSKDHESFEDGEVTVVTAGFRKSKDWEGDIVRYYRFPLSSPTKSCKNCRKRLHDHGWIETKEGGHIVCPGDWIITGVAGEHYPCKPEIFEATYEVVE